MTKLKDAEHPRIELKSKAGYDVFIKTIEEGGGRTLEFEGNNRSLILLPGAKPFQVFYTPEKIEGEGKIKNNGMRVSAQGVTHWGEEKDELNRAEEGTGRAMDAWKKALY